MEEKERRIRALTQLYYSNLKIQEYLAAFAFHREVVPRYFEGFGKRPDILQYPSDVMGLVLKGATSFHASEELWSDPLQLHSEMVQEEMHDLRKSWDLLIDIDSPFLDCSRVACQLIIAALEQHEILTYGLKFSGSRGFHLIVSGEAFPEEFEGRETRKMFPAWPRAISEYLMHSIKREYNRRVTPLMPSLAVMEQRTQKKKEELIETLCPACGAPSKKGNLVEYQCRDCKMTMKRKDVKLTKRELRCGNCLGILDVIDTKSYFFCERCKTSSFDALENTKEATRKVTYTKEARQSAASFSQEFDEQYSGEALANLDLVLVAPRHLFRMPYSLHEKTALASVVLEKEELDRFSPRDADPLKVQLRAFLKKGEKGEARALLAAALAWKQAQESEEEREEKSRRREYKAEELIELTGVTEDMFPAPIKKLLKGGMNDGKKRGLFILITFMRACNFPRDAVETKIREWNALNQPPLKEGYIKSQMDWHFRQKKKILPPNYDNPSFYKDLGLLDKKPDVKNPIVEVTRAVRRLAG